MIRKHYKNTFFNILLTTEEFIKSVEKERLITNAKSEDKLLLKKKENFYRKKDIHYSFEIFKETIKYIGVACHKYVTQVHIIKLHNQRRNKLNIPYIFCGHIQYNGINYYLLDYGFGHTIPMFRHINGAIPMTYEDIENLVLSVQNKETTWQYMHFEQERDGNIVSFEELYIIILLKHPNIESALNKAVLTLSHKICEYL